MSSEPNTTVKDIRTDPSGTFESLWKNFGVPKARQVGSSWVTPAYNKGAFAKRLRASQEEVADKNGGDPEDYRTYRGMAKNAIAKAAQAGNDGEEPGDGVSKEAFVDAAKQGIIDSNVAENSTPLVFDPDIVAILKQDAPLAMDRLTRRGQQGYDAVFNRVDSRESPLGRIPESVVTRLQDYARDFNLDRNDVPMTIYADTAEVSDFSATAAQHYMDLEELAITARMSEYAQFHEQEVLYGDPSVGLEGGSPLGDYAFDGLETWFDNAGNLIDVSGTTENFWSDIKWRIVENLLQPDDVNVRISDLEIWTSEEMFDALEREIGAPENGLLRVDIDETDTTYNVGGAELSMKGQIDIVSSHNVDQHTYVAQDEDGDERDPWEPYQSGDTGYAEQTVGSPGDVFVVNTATAEYRELAPLSTFPLAVRGASDEVAMVEYGALVEKSAGAFGLKLDDYAAASGAGSLAP